MKTIKNRYVLLFAAAIINFVYGAAYIWTVFQPAAIEKFDLPTSSANRPFNVYMGAFVVGNILGGKLQQKIGARATLLLGSAVMMAGVFLTTLVPVSMPFMLNISYGLLGGLGSGAAYNTLIATVQRWFPDKRGMVSGITICTVGAPGLIMTPFCNNIISSYGFSKAMLIVAIIYSAICFGLVWMIDNPPANYMVPSANTSSGPATVKVASSRDIKTSEMVRTKAFWLLTFAMMFATMAYFLVNPMMKSLGMDRGLSESAAIAVVMISSITNIAGRLTAPWISDKIKRTTMLILLFIISIASVLGLTVATGPLFFLCVALLCFSYGGFFGIFPVFVSDYFGTKYAGMNYGVVMIGYGVISLLCPSIIAIGVTVAFVTAAIGCCVGIACAIIMWKQNKNN